jgi:putative tricarboxylic transport membrane protein
VGLQRAEVLSGVVLAALGALSLIEAFRLRDDWQGARLMPAVVGAVLLALGAAHLAGPARSPAVAVWPDPDRRLRVVLFFAILVLYAALLPALGFAVATTLFVWCLMRTLGAYSRITRVLLSVAIATACYVVFKTWLGMPLP